MGARPDEVSEMGLSGKATDVLSEVLRAVRLRGAVFFTVEASAPWVAEAPDSRSLAPHVLPGAEHVIEYHVVTEGSCWMGLLDEPPVRLEVGDIMVFPQGDAHVASSAPGMRAPAPGIEARRQAALGRLPVRMEITGTGGDPAQLICGFWACDARPFNPLLATLPRTIVLRATDGAPNKAMLDYFIGAAMAESRAPRAGGQAVIARLSELMFVEVVRQYVASLDPGRRGWLSGLRDEVVGRALALLHARPAHPWTLEELGRDVGASRSTFAERFVAFVGSPPMQYLAQWRMQLAASMLMGPSTLAQIAGEVGYGSEAAFSRAFKKIVGVAPAGWRAARAK